MRKPLAIALVLLIGGLLGYAVYKAADYNAASKPAVTQETIANQLKATSEQKKAPPANQSKPQAPKPPAPKPTPPPSAPATSPELAKSGPANVVTIVAASVLISMASAYAYQLRKLNQF